jgi:hypothetical protein
MNLHQVVAVARTSREIDGKGRTVRELLAGRKYSIDYYQREYKWQHKHVAELVHDLGGKFLESYEEGDERSIAIGTVLAKRALRRQWALTNYDKPTNHSPRILYDRPFNTGCGLRLGHS